LGIFVLKTSKKYLTRFINRARRFGIERGGAHYRRPFDGGYTSFYKP
jgi:hypothetical protein